MKKLLLVLVAALGLVSAGAFADDEMDVPPAADPMAAPAEIPPPSNEAAPAVPKHKKMKRKTTAHKPKRKGKHKAHKHENHAPDHDSGEVDAAPVIPDQE